MKSNNLIKLSFLVILLVFSFCCFGQEFYTFKKWNSTYMSEQNKIVFLMDTTMKQDKATFLTLKIIRENLIANGVDVEALLYPTDSMIDKNTLCLRLTPLTMVQIIMYRGLKTDVYTCKRIQIQQIYPVVKPKKSIYTEVSVSVDNFADNMEAFGIDFSKKLLKHFNIAKPYKEFRFNREIDELN